MIKTILFPTDFSNRANFALKDTIGIAKQLGAKLILLHVYSRPVPVNSKFIDTGKSLLHKRERHVEVEFSMLKEIFPELKSMEVNYVKSLGMLLDQTVAIIKKHKVDLVIMGTKGARGLEVFWNSNAYRLSQQITVPMLTIPYAAKLSEIKNIGIATNYDENSHLQPLGVVKQLADTYNAKVYIVRVHNDKKKQTLTSKEQGVADKMSKVLTSTKHVFDYSLNKDLESGILEFAEEKNVQMICVVQTKRNFFEDLLHDSVTKQLALGLNMPLLILNKPPKG